MQSKVSQKRNLREAVYKYFKDGVPRCPSGGEYELTTVAEKPTCTIEGHTLSQEEEEEDEDRRR